MACLSVWRMITPLTIAIFSKTFMQSIVNWNISPIARLLTTAIPMTSPLSSSRTVKLNDRSSPSTVVGPDPVAEAVIETPVACLEETGPMRCVLD